MGHICQNRDARVNKWVQLAFAAPMPPDTRSRYCVAVPLTDENGRQLKALLDYLLDGDIEAKAIYDSLGTSSSTYYRRIKEPDYPNAEELRQVAATLNIALQGLAVLLMSPWASETVGQLLHTLTGKWNLEDYIGHDAYVVAASAIVYNALGRLQDDHAMQRTFKQYIERPATLCIPLLLATFSLGNGSAVYRPDFFQVPTDPWLTAYWIIL